MKTTCTAIVLLFIIASAFDNRQSSGGGGAAASIERGKKIYATYCLTCHQADGGGVPNMNPPLIQTKWILGDKKQLVKIVSGGLKGGEIVIDDDEFHNPMPAQTQLTDQQIADVLTYVRNSFGNKASAVTLTDVAAGKPKTATAAAATTVSKPPVKTPAKSATKPTIKPITTAKPSAQKTPVKQ